MNVFKYFLLGFLFLALSGTPCHAHKIKMFASAEGNVITGYVYYTTGGKPKNATILVQDRDKNSLGEARTQEEGKFTFTAEFKQDYIFVLELADGHRTSFRITADELPDSLPVANVGQIDNLSDEQDIVKNSVQTSLIGNPVEGSKSSQEYSLEKIERIIDNAVVKQIRPLREQLEKYEEKIRLHDILGGIGYIIGFMGLWLFLGERQKRNESSQNSR